MIFTFVEVSFVKHVNSFCNSNEKGKDNSGRLDKCKEECAGKNDCAGVGLFSGKCLLYRLNCRDNLVAFNRNSYMKAN